MLHRDIRKFVNLFGLLFIVVVAIFALLRMV
jgi:hypothetical protein